MLEKLARDVFKDVLHYKYIAAVQNSKRKDLFISLSYFFPLFVDIFHVLYNIGRNENLFFIFSGLDVDDDSALLWRRFLPQPITLL